MTPATHRPFSILDLHWKEPTDSAGQPTIDSLERLSELRGDTLPEWEGVAFGPVHIAGPEAEMLAREESILRDGGESPFRTDLGVQTEMLRSVRLIRSR